MIKSLWSQWVNLEIKDGVLCRKWASDKKVYHQVIVPLSERREILEQCHDARTSGHLGVSKTLERVRNRFYWTGLQSDVRSYVTGCPQCRKRKNRSAGKSFMQLDPTGSPLERIDTDIMGPLPETERGNKYILVVADYFTKWTEAYPLKNMEAQTITEVLVEQFLTKLGVPEVIHSDQGRQYESRMFKDMCELLGIRKTRTTAFHPKSDGMVERFNKTLATMLTAYVSDHQTDWDKHLPYVLMAYRSSVHESTGYTPNMLMLGREVATPLDIMYSISKENEQQSVHEYVWKLRKIMEEAHQFTRQFTGQAMLRQKKYHDRNVTQKRFDVGDKVLVFIPQRTVGKSPSFWYGPYVVVQKHTDLTYKVQKEGDRKTMVVHIDRLRPYGSQKLGLETGSENEHGDKNEVLSDVEVDDVVNGDEAEYLPNTDLNEIELEYTNRRQRKRPKWHSDYEFDYNV